VATTLRGALEVATQRLDALVVNLGLPDGAGFDVIHAVRDRDATVPALAVAENPRREDINRAHAMRVEYVCKPYELATISGFLRRCEERDSNDARLAAEVSAVVALHGLTAAHAELLLAATMETSTLKVLAEQLGKSPGTVRTQARDIYRRLGTQTFEDVVAAIRVRVLRRG
jgi:DNA-binding NarL/FixJ family response regulator